MDELEIKTIFVLLNADPSFSITSPWDKKYNCIAWALMFDDRWIEPSGYQLDGVFIFWPSEVSKSYSIVAYRELFEHYGYEVCQSLLPEEGYRKVALYQDTDNTCTHASRLMKISLQMCHS